jgi:chaperonin cofactor prefoldin
LEAEISTTNEKNAKLERKISKLEANAKDLESKLSESENVKNELMKRVDAEKRRFLQVNLFYSDYKNEFRMRK